MSRRLLIGITGGFTFGLISLVLSWALLYESSPFFQDDLRPGWARWTWQIVDIPALMAIVVTNAEASGAIVLFAQWFLIGFFVAWYSERVRDSKG